MSGWYRTGSVAITSGTTALVGTGTLWSSQVKTGDIFTVDFVTLYEITMTDDTHITLDRNYAGTTLTGASYAIIRNFTNSLNADIASKVSALVQQYQDNTNKALGGLFLDGSVSTPGISYQSEPGSGWWRVSAGVQALSVLGAEALRIDGNKNLLLGTTANAGGDSLVISRALAASVRITAGANTQASQLALAVSGTGGDTLYAVSNGPSASGAVQGIATGVNGLATAIGPIALAPAGTVRLNATTSGVDVTGALTASTSFTLTNNQNASTNLTVANSTTGTGSGAMFLSSSSGGTAQFGVLGAGFTTAGVLVAGACLINSNAPAGIVINTSGSALPIKFGQNGTEIARFDTSGNFCIGTTSANGALLTVGGSANAIQAITLQNTSSGANAYMRYTLYNGTSTAGLILVGASGTPVAMHRADGLALEATGAGGLTLGTTNVQPIYFGISSSEVARFDASGNFLIGTTTAVGLVTVRKDANGITKVELQNQSTGTGAIAEFHVSDGSSAALGMGITGSGFTTSGALTASMGFVQGTHTAGLLVQNSVGPLLFGAGSTAERARIDTSGRLLIGYTADTGGGQLFQVNGALLVNSATMIATKTAFTNGAAAAAGTLTNAPAAGNPTKWIPINDNGTTRYMPAW